MSTQNIHYYEEIGNISILFGGKSALFGALALCEKYRLYWAWVKSTDYTENLWKVQIILSEKYRLYWTSVKSTDYTEPVYGLIRVILRGGSRIISEGFELMKLPYLLYVFRQTLENSVDPDQTLQNAASDYGLHCFPLIQQFYTHSQAVKLTCRREVKGKEQGCE